MTKKELVNRIRDCTEDYTKTEIKDIIDLFCDVVMETVAEGEQVTLSDFGKFRRHDAEGRVYINPSTKKKSNLPARGIPKFTAGKKFREMVYERGGKQDD